MQESSPGWAYFAKKEYDSGNEAPQILYAYGKNENGGAGTPPIWVNSIQLSSYSVRGGTPVGGTVYLNGPAPPGGLAIAISTDGYTLVTSPAFVPAGSTSAAFTLCTAIVSEPTDVIIMTYNSSATLQLTP